MAMTMQIASINTSKVVGRKMVRIPWKMQIGIMNCAQTALTCLNQGGKEYGLYFRMGVPPLMMKLTNTHYIINL